MMYNDHFELIFPFDSICILSSRIDIFNTIFPNQKCVCIMYKWVLYTAKYGRYSKQ